MLVTSWLVLSVLGLGIVSIAIRFFIVGVVTGLAIHAHNGLPLWLVACVALYAVIEFTIKACHDGPGR